jgi:DNA-binding NtrC family response regulator
MGELFNGAGTILFVDDEKSIRIMAKIMLKRLGYKVETIPDPKNALGLFQSKPDMFDLVITEMIMPQMTGLKLYEKLQEIRSNVPVIICSGHSTFIDEAKAKKLGIAGYVMKPMSMTRLEKAIRKALDK